MRLQWAVALIVAFAGTAWAQGDETRRRLEDLQRRLGELEGSRPAEQAGDPSGIRTEFKDGLHFSTADGNFDAHVGGRMITHFRSVFDLPESSSRSSDTFFLRQIRLEMSGTFYRDFEFKVQTDFPTGSTSSNTGTLQDGYLGWKHFPESSVRIGQFKVPFSQEETESTRFIDFVDRSDLNRLTPQRDIGLMLYGKVFEGIVEYEAAVFNGQGRAVLDGNDEKDFAARLRVNPFLRSDIELPRGLRLGVAGTNGDVDEGSINGLDLTSRMLDVKFLDATAGEIDGRRSRIGVELSYLYGPFSLRAEWMRRTDEFDIGASNDEDVESDAWYVAATYLLTGEMKPLRVLPAHPFDPAAGDWGAFELAARIGALTVDDRVFSLGVADPTTNSNEVLTATFGVNWYLTRNFRISPNVVYERYGDGVAFDSNTREDHAWGAMVRFQIDF